MAERIADYCDAVLVIDVLCKPGYKCCVSRDAFGDSPPPELLVIDRLNSSRYDEKNGASSKVSSPLTTTRPNMSTSVSATAITTIAMTTTMPTSTLMAATRQPPTAMTTTSLSTTRPKPVPFKPCKGKCTSGLSALFCENIDGDADCPPDDSVLTVCCVNESLPQKPVIKFKLYLIAIASNESSIFSERIISQLVGNFEKILIMFLRTYISYLKFMNILNFYKKYFKLLQILFGNYRIRNFKIFQNLHI